MSQRFQFSLRWLFVAMLAVACFFGGIRFERERIRREEAAVLAAQAKTEMYRLALAELAQVLEEKTQSPIHARLPDQPAE